MGNADNLTLEGWQEDYQAFVDKFKPKKTTDDCYTPGNVYDAVADWVAAEYGIDRAAFVRPFWPGGDFERFAYPAGSVVVDNPPFSIFSRIIRFYTHTHTRFFLFAPALTLFSGSSADHATCLPTGVQITYENGAVVPTSFVTNLESAALLVRTAPSLYNAVKAADDANRKASARELPHYVYPDQIVTAAMVQRWCKYGVDFRLSREDARKISALDAQRARGLSIFGGGFLLSSSAAAERAAAERWELSESEREMVALIDRAKSHK